MTIPWQWATVTGFIQDFLASSVIASGMGAVIAIGIAGAVILAVRRAFFS